MRAVSSLPAVGPKGVTLTLSAVPDEWAAGHGYGEIVSMRAAYGYGGAHGTLRWKPGVDKERVLFHYLSGKPAPANRGGEAGDQFNYKPRGKQADRALQVSALTGGGV